MSIFNFANVGGAVHKTGETARHIADQAAKYERDKALTPVEKITIASETTAALYRAGKFDDNARRAAVSAALNAAIDLKVNK
jgi:hypothetical protein